jgi:hypothetical protein
MCCVQVAAMQVLCLIVAVYQQQEHGELALDVASPTELAESLVNLLPESSSLRASAPGIIRLMDADCAELNTKTLCDLLGEQWMTPALFAACISHILPRVGLKVGLECLAHALDRHAEHASTLCESLTRLQVLLSAHVHNGCTSDQTT